jgi:hypothetical protein
MKSKCEKANVVGVITFANEKALPEVRTLR